MGFFDPRSTEATSDRFHCPACSRIFVRRIADCPRCNASDPLLSAREQLSDRDMTARFQRIKEIHADLSGFAASEFNTVHHSYDEDPPPYVPSSCSAGLKRIMGDWQSASDEYKQVLAVHPLSEDANCGMIALLHEIGDFESALAACDDFEHMNPVSQAVKYSRARVLLSAGRTDEALLELEPLMAERSDDRSAAAHLRGLALVGLGRCNEALIRFDAALQLSPGDAQASEGRATALLADGACSAALQQISETSAWSISGYLLHALILLRLDDVQVAERALLKGIRFGSALDRASFHTGLALVAIGRGRFREVPERLFAAQHPHARALQPLLDLLLAHAYQACGQACAAAAALARVPSRGSTLVVQLREQLRRRIAAEHPYDDDSWLLALEIQLLAQVPRS